ncbi:MAG: hypothetical protein HN833_01105 [Elusimicrobiaceae bacterium]|jgi:hypothetical protein|nr:hypothetical protein [Elusimicrobiaceae bacterium]MBT3954642.1 hypothetical protein [Elusimicrobiaceae bacterium]MBT4007950.1 hypothetical protein [Elusimicrobiaceae bacterium]MBT4403299.1 hypothetical protein [Elusimicrobiaceae bacterium]MBT4439964.1 hypothetical protein [Elusimicrobiaceae bacterium]
MLKKLAVFLCTIFIYSGLATAGNSVNVDFVMNFYNKNSAQDIRSATLIENRMGDRVNINFIPFIMKNSKTQELTSQYGAGDLEESKIFLTIKNNYPEKVNNYILAIISGSSWQEATVYVGLSPIKIKKMVQKNGDSYIKKEYDYLKSKNIKSGSAILVDGSYYNGKRDLTSLMNNINSKLNKDRRIFISKDKVKFNMYIVEHHSFAQGKESQQLTQNLEKYINMPAEVKRMSVKEAKTKFKGIDIDFLPLYIIEKDDTIEALFTPAIERGSVIESGKYIALPKSTREGVFVGKQRKENLLEVFVMSQCPYGVMAENAIIASLNEGTFPEDVKVRIRYIASENGEGFNSLHGKPEWEENVRQLLIQEMYPEKFYKYLFHRNQDYRTENWKDAAKKAGINPAKIDRNFEKGKDLLRADIKYSDSYGASASPTLLWEGQLLTNMNALTKMEKFKNFNPKASPDKAPTGSCG